MSAVGWGRGYIFEETYTRDAGSKKSIRAYHCSLRVLAVRCGVNPASPVYSHNFLLMIYIYSQAVLSGTYVAQYLSRVMVVCSADVCFSSLLDGLCVRVSVSVWYTARSVVVDPTWRFFASAPHKHDTYFLPTCRWLFPDATLSDTRFAYHVYPFHICCRISSHSSYCDFRLRCKGSIPYQAFNSPIQ